MDNILQENAAVQAMMNSRSKMAYLQREKQRLEVAVLELTQKNALQRTINSQLTHSHPQEATLLQKTNQHCQNLADQYQRILAENEQLSGTLLLQQQIQDEGSLQHQHILKTYEDKILELRRAIQGKESFIQMLESKLTGNEQVTCPPNNVTMLFYHEIDELKKHIDTLTKSNRELEREKEAMGVERRRVERQNQMMRALTMHSALGFGEFKRMMGERVTKSVPKPGTFLPGSVQKPEDCQKKLNEADIRSTREVSEFSQVHIDLSVKMMTYHLSNDNQKLKKFVSDTKKALLAAQESNKLLVASHQKAQKKMDELNTEVSYYKRATQDMAKLLTHRRDHLRGSSQSPSKDHQVLARVKVPQEVTYSSDRGKLWKAIQAGLRYDKKRIVAIKKNCKGSLRSVSCIGDYRINIQDEVDRFMIRKPTMRAKKMEEAGNDFSMMIGEGRLADLSVIHSSSQPKTYSQWKHREKKADLTVIGENIL